MPRTKRIVRTTRPPGVDRLMWRLMLGEDISDEPDQQDASMAQLCFEIRAAELHARYADEIAAALRDSASDDSAL